MALKFGVVGCKYILASITRAINTLTTLVVLPITVTDLLLETNERSNRHCYVTKRKPTKHRFGLDYFHMSSSVSDFYDYIRLLRAIT